MNAVETALRIREIFEKGPWANFNPFEQVQNAEIPQDEGSLTVQIPSQNSRPRLQLQSLLKQLKTLHPKSLIEFFNVLLFKNSPPPAPPPKFFLLGQHDENSTSDSNESRYESEDVEGVVAVATPVDDVEGTAEESTTDDDDDTEARIENLHRRSRQMTRDFSSLYEIIDRMSEIRLGNTSNEETSRIIKEVHNSLKKRRAKASGTVDDGTVDDGTVDDGTMESGGPVDSGTMGDGGEDRK
ncbi:hypothetical protein Avbf_17082 [Armadillidium vulgare]|nr:hypothetical protein Avbf_17082 [Armadillidium vulgare]